MKVDFIRPGAEVLRRVKKIGFVHPTTVQIAIDTLGPDKTVCPELALHPGGERAEQEGMHSFCASILAVKAEGEMILFLGHPHALHTIPGAELQGNVQNHRVHVEVQMAINVRQM